MHLPPEFVESESWPSVLGCRSNIQPLPAVYALLNEHNFGRLNGESRILYIGKTGELGGASEKCRLRIYNYPNGKHAKELRRRTQLLTNCGIEVTFKWKHVNSAEEAASEEARLLTEYESEHGELPPFNAKNEHGL